MAEGLQNKSKKIEQSHKPFFLLRKSALAELRTEFEWQGWAIGASCFPAVFQVQAL
jgi:hypothetical protein